ncbi:glycosyltransferase [Pseudomonadota bacterium]|nr:glycosyltransferase [Pseudomonadota bacterium]
MRILYISYDGLLEPLGQSQVLAYQLELAKKYKIFILSFEKRKDLKNDILVQNTKSKINQAGITWYPLTYHRRFSILATSFDIFCGFIISAYLLVKHKIDIIHARSYVPSVIGLSLKLIMNVKFIFDMRGFWADEKVDSGSWKSGSLIYKVSKRLEKSFILQADYLISLTFAGVNEIKKFPYVKKPLFNFKVISTCANLELFKKKDIPKGAFTLGYVGSAGLWYQFEAVIRAFNELLYINPKSKLIIINRNEHEMIEDIISKTDIPTENIILIESSYDQVPEYMNQMHAGIFFIKPYFSKKASAPTRLGEFLGCGIPCLSNQGVGDMEEILEENNVGIAIKDFSDKSIRLGIKDLLALTNDQQTSRRCIDASNKYFSLHNGVSLYAEVYESLRD